jgi:hypothetical protein
MGAIARNIANKITTSGVFTSGAITNASVTGITVLANASDGITFISSQTASNSASISFTSGLTSTYKAYKFVFVNINPSTTNTQFQFNLSTDSGSNYNVTKTTTFFNALHNEADTAAQVNYDGGTDLAQSTSYQTLGRFLGNNSDDSLSGTMSLFNPSSTTYVKHFISNCSNPFVNTADADSPYAFSNFMAGYGNTTSAVNAIRFQMSSGNIDAGTIYMYGIK